jgi:hypothetical protein
MARSDTGGPAVASAASNAPQRVSRRGPVRGPGAVVTTGTEGGGMATAPGGTRTGGGSVRNCTREISICQQKWSKRSICIMRSPWAHRLLRTR